MLTHIQITSAKPAAKPYNLSDSQGLHLSVRPNGSKLWRMDFRHLGTQKTLHIGPWPEISLAEARVRRDDARKALAAGLDPVLEKKRAQVTAKFATATSFKEVAQEGWPSVNAKAAPKPPSTRSGGS